MNTIHVVHIIFCSFYSNSHYVTIDYNSIQGANNKI